MKKKEKCIIMSNGGDKMKKLIRFILSLFFLIIFLYYSLMLINNYFSLSLKLVDYFKINELFKKYNLNIVYIIVSGTSLLLFILCSLKKKKTKKVKDEKNEVEQDNSRQIRSVNNDRIRFKNSFLTFLIILSFTIGIIYLINYFGYKENIINIAYKLNEFINNNIKVVLIVLACINVIFFIQINHYKKLDILINTNYCYIKNKIKNDNLLWIFYSPYYMAAPLIYGTNDLKIANRRKFETLFIGIIKYIFSLLALIFLIIPLINSDLNVYFAYIKDNYILILILLFGINIDMVLYFIFKILPIFDIFNYRIKLNYADVNITKKAYKNKENIFKIFGCEIVLLLSYVLFPFAFLSYKITRIKNTNAFVKRYQTKQYIETLYDVFKVNGG